MFAFKLFFFIALFPFSLIFWVGYEIGRKDAIAAARRIR
jgi:hypothetical protein